MAPPDGLSGGEKLMAYLAAVNQRLAATTGVSTVGVGFLEGATYPDGTSVAMVAATQEWGATINREAAQTTIYRQVNAAATKFLKNGRFVKASKANFASTHATPAYTIIIPPRPFFRGMIKDKGPGWGDDMAKILPAAGYDAATALGRMGDRIKGQLQQSIVSFSDPRNAPSTIRKKGFDDPLVDIGHMLNSVDYEVSA